MNQSRKAESASNLSSPELIEQLLSLSLEDSLESMADILRGSINCEAVSILIWDDREQRLITKYKNGIPSGLRYPESYRADEGITGRVLFTQEERLRCLIDLKSKTIRAARSDQRISPRAIQWRNMNAFSRFSKFKDLKSLLGAPIFIGQKKRGQQRTRKFGVVKLINKIDAHHLDPQGFSEKDDKLLTKLLNVFETVLSVKMNEWQMTVLTGLIRDEALKQDPLKQIALECTRILNCQICVIRRQDRQRLKLVASNLALEVTDNYEEQCDPAAIVVREKAGVVWKAIKRPSSFLRLKGIRGTKEFTLASPSERISEIITTYNIDSFMILPIMMRNMAIGSLECYSTQSRGFLGHEIKVAETFTSLAAGIFVQERQQRFLHRLSELQSAQHRSAGETSEEDSLVQGVLVAIQEALGSRIKPFVLFDRAMLARSTLNCKPIYSVTKSGRHSQMLENAWSLSKSTAASRTASNSGSRKFMGLLGNKGQSFKLNHNEPPVGMITIDGSTSFDPLVRGVLQAAARDLGLGLRRIRKAREFQQLETLLEESSKLLDLKQMYKFILRQTFDYFGFDYCAISLVDSATRRIVSEAGDTRNSLVANPQKWKRQSVYGLDSDNDILVYVAKTKRTALVNGPTALKGKYGQYLNREVFEKYRHADLVRLFIPFVFEETSSAEQRPEFALGVIEAGFHIHTRRRIPTALRHSFEFFIKSCANSLQRVILLEQNRAGEAILHKLQDETEPSLILRKLLRESAQLVGGDSGDISFLNHRNKNLMIDLQNPITYRIPRSKIPKLKVKQVVSIDGPGISSRVAAIKKPYWTNDAKKDKFYVEEFPYVNSELCVPLIHAREVIGVLTIDAEAKNKFDERKANLVQAVLKHAVPLYQRARVNDTLTKLISPFNVFATQEAIYRRMIELVESFIGTETVSVWEKVPIRNDFELQWVGVSSSVRDAYAKAPIKRLRSDTYTGDVVKTGQIVRVDRDQLRAGRFVSPQIAIENEFEYMTGVPIKLGNEVYGVIDVFSRRPTPLFKEEEDFLGVLAQRAAVALQSAKLIQSFNEISSALPEGKIEDLLQHIADSAVKVLNANPVILYRFDPEFNTFIPKPIISGWLYDETLRNLESEVTENDLANKIRLHGKRYFKNGSELRRFEQKVKRRWRGTFKRPFWEREHIRSMAALPLEHGDEIVGILFVNYRSSQNFSEHQRIIEAFASQATSAIVSAKSLAENKVFWELRRRDSLALALSHVIPGLAHNAGKIIESMNLNYLAFRESVRDAPGDTLSKKVCQKFAYDLKRLLDALKVDFSRLKDYRAFDEFNEERCNITDLIGSALRILSKELKDVEVVRPKGRLPAILCDKSQIRHMFLNVFLNSIKAMEQTKHKALRIVTSCDLMKSWIKIEITDNGRGVPLKAQARIFEPGFSTTKDEGGTGYGLSISRYIAKNHGGSIELEESTDTGTTFSISLPVRR